MTSSSSPGDIDIVSQEEDNENTLVIDPVTSTTIPEKPVITRKSLEILTKTVDPEVQLDEETEDLLLRYTGDVLEKIIQGACELTAHRNAAVMEAKDVQLFLERQMNGWVVPSSISMKMRKKTISEAHRQRMALIKRTMKKC